MRRKGLSWLAKALLLIVIATALQVLVVSQVRVLGVTADIFLVLTVIVGLSRGSLEGALFGFFAGVVQDIIYFGPLGVRALVLVLVGYMVGMFAARLGTVNLWLVFATAGVSSLSGQLVYGLFQYVMGPRAGFLTMMGVQMIPGALFDALIAVPVYILLLRTKVLPSPRPDKSSAGSNGE